MRINTVKEKWAAGQVTHGALTTNSRTRLAKKMAIAMARA